MNDEATRRWVLADFPRRPGGYAPGDAPSMLRPALSRSVRFFDVATDAAFGPGANGLPVGLDGDIGLEMRWDDAAVLSLQMSHEEIARALVDVLIRDDSPTRSVALTRSASRSRGSGQDEAPIATIERIGVVKAWTRTKGEKARVAVVDSGVNSAHPDLGDIAGWTFVPETTPEDRLGHGTRCAGVLVARLNGSGLIGVAPSASVVSLKVIDDSGNGWGGWMAGAILWCAVYGIQVANVSVKLDATQPTLEWLFDSLSSAVLVVAAAGNRSPGEDTAVVAPARYPTVIAVAGLDESLRRLAPFSRFGPEVDIAAPAVSVRTTSGAAGYKTCQGTSVACPHVAGTAALVFSAYPDAEPREVGRRLKETAQPIATTGDLPVGAGLVDADAATA